MSGFKSAIIAGLLVGLLFASMNYGAQATIIGNASLSINSTNASVTVQNQNFTESNVTTTSIQSSNVSKSTSITTMNTNNSTAVQSQGQTSNSTTVIPKDMSQPARNANGSMGFVPEQRWQPTGCCPPHPTGTPFTVVFDNQIPTQASLGSDLTITGRVILGQAYNESDVTRYNVSKQFYDTYYPRLQLEVNLFKTSPSEDPVHTSTAQAFCDELANKTITTGSDGTFTLTWKVAPTTSDGQKAWIYLTAFTGYTGSTINYASVTTTSFGVNIMNSASGAPTAATTNCFNQFNNPTTKSALGTIALDGSPQKIAVNPNTDRVYVAKAGSLSVSVIDGKTNTLLPNINTNSTSNAVAVNPITNMVYATINKGILVIDGSSNKVVGTIPNGDFAMDIAINPKTDRIYAVNQNLGTVSVIDGKSNTKLIDVPVDQFSQALAVDTADNKVYVASFSQGAILVIDGYTNTVTNRIQLGEAELVIPYSIAIDEQTDRVYVADLDYHAISVIDSKTDTLINTIKIGYPLQSITLDERTNKVFVVTPDYDAGTVFVMDGKSNTLLASVELSRTFGSYAYYAAFDNSTGTLYVTTALGVVAIDTSAIVDNLGTAPTQKPQSDNTTQSATPSNTGSSTTSGSNQGAESGTSASQDVVQTPAESTNNHPENTGDQSASQPSTNVASNEATLPSSNEPSSQIIPGISNSNDTTNKPNATLEAFPSSQLVIPDIFRFIPPALLIIEGVSHNSSMAAVMQDQKVIENPLFVLPTKISANVASGQMLTFSFFGDQPENNTAVAQVLNGSQAYPVLLQDMCKPYDLMCQHVFKITNVSSGDYLLLISSFHKGYIAYYVTRVHVK